ncbi:MAG: 6-phosphogluconolactonase, partial [Candidatus Peregrinibacteria bacterium]
MTPTIIKTSFLPNFVQTAQHAIESFIEEQYKHKRILRIALSGGKDLIPVYEALAHSKKIDWSRIQLFLVDEYYGPLNSDDSTYRVIQKHLIEPAGNVRKFYSYNTRESLKKLVAQYQATLEQLRPPLFDLVILGLGAYGHTASLFPRDPALHESRRLVIHTVRPGAEPQ